MGLSMCVRIGVMGVGARGTAGGGCDAHGRPWAQTHLPPLTVRRPDPRTNLAKVRPYDGAHSPTT